jgi:tetratricopeptide (TPR) repeat protein
MQYHLQAIQLAETLTADRHLAIRVAAKEVCIDAHLGAAHDIAWGDWREKERSVETWLAKAAAQVDEMIKNDEGDEDYRFRLASRALSVYLGIQGRRDPSNWVRDVVRSGDALVNATPDPGRKSQLQWEMAMALYDALQIFQMRSDHESAIKYGQLAISYLEKSGRQNQSATTGYLLGRLYFRIGAVYAVHENDHTAAVTWFDKAVPLLGKTPPAEAMNDLGRLGDTFVSMGVSYWKADQRDKALALTQHGANLMEDAVKRGDYDASALAVPYANLASMHRDLGQSDKADRLEEMAAKIKNSKVR